MKIGEVRDGFKLLYVAKVSVEGGTYERGKIVSPTFHKIEGEPTRRIPDYAYPALEEETLYVTPAGVAKRASGIEIKERT
jgi:hypothetical protein